MRYSKFNLSEESGSATLEFLAFGVVAGFSILLASQQLMSLQHQQFMVQQFSKQLARALVHQSTATEIETAVETLSQSYSIDPKQVKFQVTCQPTCDQLDAIQSGALIDVRVTYLQVSSVTRMRALR